MDNFINLSSSSSALFCRHLQSALEFTNEIFYFVFFNFQDISKIPFWFKAIFYFLLIVSTFPIFEKCLLPLGTFIFPFGHRKHVGS